SSLLIIPSLFLSNDMILSTMSSTPSRPGPPNPRGGPSFDFDRGGCATTAAPARTTADTTADASQNLMLLMRVLLVRAKGAPLLEGVGELRVGEELLVGQRLQEGDEGRLLRVREVEPAHPRVEVGVGLDPLAVVVNHLVERVEPPVVHVRGGVLDVA